MNREVQTLDEALAALPRDATPSRDLWPEIRAEISAGVLATRGRGLHGWRLQLAAGIVLMVATSAITYLVTRNSLRAGASPPVLVDLGPEPGTETLSDAKYLRARADLEHLFEQRIAALPPATRAKLQGNLAELRHAADEISATLAEHPADSLLQELLQSTRRRELQLLADVSEMPNPNS